MMRPIMFALLGLAILLTVVSPSQANAGVVIGVGVGPVYPGAAYGYVVAHPGPYYYPRPYVYAPGYVYPAYRYYGRIDRDRRWDRRDWDHRDRDRDRRDYDRHEYRR
jgi:hypothetical protein